LKKVYSPKPSERVADYVQRILVLENFSISSPFGMPLFANGTPTLLFVTSKASIADKPTNHLTLFGQTVFPTTLSIAESFSLIAYFLQPQCLTTLFKISASELTNQPVELNLIENKKASELQDQLLNASSTQEMICLLDNFILSGFSNKHRDEERVKHAAALIAKCPTKEILSKVLDQLFVTERTFERMFEQHIGVNPSLYRRICQFHNSFQQLNQRQFVKLSDVAFQNGYSDQSHFIRSFKEFANVTPKEYLKFGQAE
jgi:AraC-like DNA-binding protein